MKIGENYSSYEELMTALELYKDEVCNDFWIRDARTISNQKKRFPKTVDNVNESLKYYYIRFSCIKGGRCFKPRNSKPLRKCSTGKQDCKSSIFVRVSKCQQYLTVVEINEEHNHAKLKFRLPKPLKDVTKVKLKGGMNKKAKTSKVLADSCMNKSFMDVVKMLQETYQCHTNILIDENNAFNGLYFQDKRMTEHFKAFPEILFIDKIYCLVERITTVYIAMIEDGNGSNEIVAVCLLTEENQESIEFFIKTFKNRNSAWSKVKVVMSDKDDVERKILKKHFPGSKLMISLFHVNQMFNKEISHRCMQLHLNEMNECKKYLQKLMKANSEDVYKATYKEMMMYIPDTVKKYYEKNWAPIAHEWVKCYTERNICLSDTTNNRLKSLYAKLRSVISENCTLKDLVQYIQVFINSSRISKDVRVMKMLNKRLAKPLGVGTVKAHYSDYLTTFAFVKVEKELDLVKSCKKFYSLKDNRFYCESSEGRLITTPFECECQFWKSNNLPCRHIFKCRKILSLPLFDRSLCMRRWTKNYSEELLQRCECVISKNIESMEKNCTTEGLSPVTTNNGKIPREMTNHEKFLLMYKEARQMAQLEATTPIFFKRLDFMKKIIQLWSEGKDSILYTHFAPLFNQQKSLTSINSNEKIGKQLKNENSAEHGGLTNIDNDELQHMVPIIETEDHMVEEFLEEEEDNQNIEIEFIEEDDDYQIIEEEFLEEEDDYQIIEEFLEEGDDTHSIQELSLKEEESNQNMEEEFLEEEEDIKIQFLQMEEEYDENTVEHVIRNKKPCLKSPKIPTANRKRGRPKGTGSTVVGSKHKKLKK